MSIQLRSAVALSALALASMPCPARAEARPASEPSADERAVAADVEATPLDDDLRRRIERLIEQLGARSFAERERASDGLREIGLPAKRLLLEAGSHADAEISLRARKLLKAVLAEDFQRRIAAFVADTEGLQKHDLPAWNEFREMVGDEAAARALFVKMIQSEILLLEAYDNGPKEASRALAMRCTQMYERARRPNLHPKVPRNEYFSLGSVAAVYFVAAHPKVDVDQNLANRINMVVHRSPFHRVMGSGEAPAMKRVLGAWMLNNASSNIAWQNVALAMRYDIKEGIEPAKALLRGGRISPNIRASAIMAVARFGGEEDAELLLDLTDDDSLVRNNKQMKCQMRDVALVALLHMNNQDPAEYGFEVTAQPTTIYNLQSIGFKSDADRDAAFEQWAAFRDMGE